MSLNLSFYLRLSFFCLYALFCHSLNAQLTLQQCIEQAINNNEKMSIADLQVLIQSDRVSEAWGRALPSLNGQVDYIASGEPNRFFKKHKVLNAKASLLIPIYNFGEARYSIKTQNRLYEASLHTSERVRQELVNEVSQAYFRLLESYHLEKVVLDSIATLTEQHRISRDFYSQGLVHANEPLLVETQLSQRELDLIQARQNISLASAQLNRLMGTDIYADLNLVDIQESDALGSMKRENKIELLIQRALRVNPALNALQLQVEAAYYAYRTERGSLYPSVYAFSDWSTTNDYALPYTQGINAGIGIRMTFFDASSSAKIRRKEKEWQELQMHYQGMIDDLTLGISSAHLTVQNALNKIPVASKSIALAEQNLAMTQDQYREGLVSLYDVLMDEERVAHSRANYFQALYHFHRAKAELEFIAGYTPETSCDPYF